MVPISPSSSRPTTRGRRRTGLFAWYSAIAATFPDMPIVLYNVPIRTAVDVAPETVARLRRAHDEHRRDQGDDQGLRALLADVPSLRQRLADVVGHRVALPAAAGDRRHRLRQRRRQHRAEGGCRHVRPLGRGRSRSRRSTCTTPCIRSSICSSSRPTRRRSSACWNARALIASGFVRPPLIPVTERGQRPIERTAGRRAAGARRTARRARPATRRTGTPHDRRPTPLRPSPPTVRCPTASATTSAASTSTAPTVRTLAVDDPVDPRDVRRARRRRRRRHRPRRRAPRRRRSRRGLAVPARQRSRLLQRDRRRDRAPRPTRSPRSSRSTPASRSPRPAGSRPGPPRTSATSPRCAGRSTRTHSAPPISSATSSAVPRASPA